MSENNNKRWANDQELKIMKEKIKKEMKGRWDKSSLSDLKERTRAIKEARAKRIKPQKGSVTTLNFGNLFELSINLGDGKSSLCYKPRGRYSKLHYSDAFEVSDYGDDDTDCDTRFLLKVIDGEAQGKK